MKTLPILVLKRGVHFPNGCVVKGFTTDEFESVKDYFEETSLDGIVGPVTAIMVQPELLDILNAEETHAIYMHEQGHQESGHESTADHKSLSLVQEIQADDWAISEAGVKPSVLRTALMKVIDHVCEGDAQLVAMLEELCAPRFQFLV